MTNKIINKQCQNPSSTSQASPSLRLKRPLPCKELHNHRQTDTERVSS